MEDSSKKYTTVSTQKGLYQYNRLPFGMSSAPAVYQRTIEGVLAGIRHVCVFLDDMLVTGKTEEQNLEKVRKMLERVELAGSRLKRKSCSFRYIRWNI